MFVKITSVAPQPSNFLLDFVGEKIKVQKCATFMYCSPSSRRVGATRAIHCSPAFFLHDGLDKQYQNNYVISRGETNIPNPESFESKTDSNESFRIRIRIFESNIITMRNCTPAPRRRS